MFLLEDKIKARIHEIDAYRYRDAVKIPEFRFLLDDKGQKSVRILHLLTTDGLRLKAVQAGKGETYMHGYPKRSIYHMSGLIKN